MRESTNNNYVTAYARGVAAIANQVYDSLCRFTVYGDEEADEQSKQIDLVGEEENNYM